MQYPAVVFRWGSRYLKISTNPTLRHPIPGYVFKGWARWIGPLTLYWGQVLGEEGKDDYQN